MNILDVVVALFAAVSMIVVGLCFALALLKINKEQQDED